MDGRDLLLKRRSIRKYKDEVVSGDTMLEIVEVAQYAPSWANYQIARYTVITDPDIIRQIGEDGLYGFAYNIGTLKNAKTIVVLSFVQGKSGKLDIEKKDYATSKANQWELFDAGIACQTFCLAAFEHGVGTCIFGVIDDKKIADIVHLPKEETVATVITCGYPAEDVPAPPRKKTDEILRFLN